MKSGKWFGQSVNILSELLRNPGKGTLGSQNSKKIPKGNRSVFILDPLLQRLVNSCLANSPSVYIYSFTHLITSSALNECHNK